MSAKVNKEMIEHALMILSKGKARVFEVRVPKAGRFKTISGYFNNLVALGDALVQLDQGEHEGTYLTLNPVSPALLSRASNRWENWAALTTNDTPEQILRREWMLVDIDPVRPAGISSTNEEKLAAKNKAIEVRKWLREQGWPVPVGSDSGNGYHLLYSVDLPNDDLSRDTIRGCLEALAEKFDTPAVHIDRKVYNSSRIVKAYGTVARKGDDTEERPWRTAAMFASPEKIEDVTLAQIAAIADLAEKKTAKKTSAEDGPWTEASVLALFEAAKWEHAKPVPHKNAQKYVGLCPRNRDHAGFAVFFENGWVNVECFHDSCADFKKAEQFVEETGADFAIPGREPLDMDFLGVMNADEEIEEGRKAGQQLAGIAQPFSLEDLGNMERLVWRHGSNLKHTESMGWLVWDGKRWQPDDVGRVQRFAWNTVRLIPEEAKLVKVPPKEENEEAHDAALAKVNGILKWAAKSESGNHISLMLGHAESAAGVSAAVGEFDQDMNLLNTNTGTIDLVTGGVQAHEREDMLTKIAPVDYDPDAVCPNWEKFLSEIMGGDREMVDFLRRAVGYSLTGETTEQCMFVLWGTGANGKSTFVETIKHVLGNYAATADFGTFTAARQTDGGRGANPAIAKLKGARFVAAAESEHGQKFAEALVKQMTGTDTISVRNLYKSPFDFKPQFKVWLASNYKPQISGTDDGIWRRIRLIPFAVSFLGCENKGLPETLKREAAGILAWAVRGASEWRRHGLMPPTKVLKATDEYRADEDEFQQFLEDRCEIGVKRGGSLAELRGQNPKHQAKARDLWKEYSGWAKDNNAQPLTERKFSEAMKQRGFSKDIRENGRYWLGIKLTGEGWIPETVMAQDGEL